MFEAIYFAAPLSTQEKAFSSYNDTTSLRYGDYANLGDYFLFTGRPAESIWAYQKADIGFRKAIRNVSDSYLAYLVRSGGWNVIAKSYANTIYACLDQKNLICADTAIARVRNLDIVVGGERIVPSFLLLEMITVLSVATQDMKDSTEANYLMKDIWAQDSTSVESQGLKSLWAGYWKGETGGQVECGDNVRCLLYSSLSLGSQGAREECENVRHKMAGIGSLYSVFFSKRNLRFNQPIFPCEIK